MLTAIFVPSSGSAFEAMQAAADLAAQASGLKLYFNGERLALLPHPLPGWHRIGACHRSHQKDIEHAPIAA